MKAAEIARALGQDDVEARRRAVLALPAVRDPAVGSLLLRALGDRDWRVRAEAVRVGRLAAERLGAIRDVVEAARQHDDVGLRSAALELLLSGAEPMLDALLSALPGWEERSRRVAIDALSRSGHRSAVQRLLAGTRDLGATSIDALAELPGPEADAELRRRLRAVDAFERVAAVDALNRRGTAVPFEELRPLLQDRLASRGALRALGRSGQVEALGPLLDSLVDPRDLMATTALLALAEAVESASQRDELVRRLGARGESAKARMRQLGGQGGEGAGLAALTCLALAQDRAAIPLAAALRERGVDPLVVERLLAPIGPEALREVARPPAPVPATPRAGSRASMPALASAFGGKRSSRRPPLPATIFDLPRLSPEDFRALQGLVRASSGIVLQDDQRATVERKLGERVMALGMPGFGPYIEHLRHDPAAATEVERVIDVVAVHETYFFRESPQLFAFRDEVLPVLREQIGPRGNLTLWSAGCSTGEEAYTLAMLVAQSGLFADATVRVIANDISRRVVQIARRGVYRGSSFRALPPEYERYFVDVELEGGRGRQVRDDIRACVHFTRLNLLDGSRAAIVGRVNAVFCRNLLIYFDEQARGELVQAFHERLLPGGFLMLGHSESLLHVTTAFELHQLSTDLVYRKPSAPGRP